MIRHLLAVAILAAVPMAAVAQSNSLFSGRGVGQNSSATVGAPRTSSVSANGFGSSLSSGLGQTGLTSGTSGTGRTGAGATGATGAMSALGTQQEFGLGQLGQSIGTGPFIGRSDNMGTFVGNQMAAQGGTRATQFQGLQGLQGLFRGGGNNANNRAGGQGSEPKRSIRPMQRIAFDFNPATPSIASQRATERFADLADRRPQLAGVTISADDGGRIVLRGDVASDEARELAAALVRLEPGVREVVNELRVMREPAP